MFFRTVRHGKLKRLQLGDYFFYLGEPARLRVRRFQASQTHIHGPILRNVVPLPPRRRAFRYNVFGLTRTTIPPPTIGGGGISVSPGNTLPPKTISASIPLARTSATFPRFAANHPIPSPALFPAPRTPRPNLLSKKMGTLPASGYRHATADAVGRSSDSSCPSGCAMVRMWRNTPRRSCTLGSITADSSVSFSPQCLVEGGDARRMLDCGHVITRSKSV